MKSNRSGQSVTNRVTEYRNDAWGNVIGVICKDGANPANYIISNYDWAGQLTAQYKGLNGSEVNYGTLNITANAGDYSKLLYEYDDFGNVTTVTDAMGNIESMTYYTN